jgi:hypothetical protein
MGTAVAAALLAASPAAAFKLKWQPVDKALLAETKSQIDPEASSEVVSTMNGVEIWSRRCRFRMSPARASTI